MWRSMGMVALLFMATNAFAEDKDNQNLSHKQGENHHSPHWSYSGDYDPYHWGDISGNEVCKIGKMQSPINITPKVIGKDELRHINFQYMPASGDAINNGHTIQFNLGAQTNQANKIQYGNMINVSGKIYNLLQFHFHTPSEERFDGKTYPMVAHMVHKSNEGELAVVAILFKIGGENQQLRQMFNTLPKSKDDKVNITHIDIQKLLPEQHSYYGFTGSLTTPPCTEGVKWHVLKHPVEISQQQYGLFKSIYSMNARPAQPVNDREIFISE